MASKQIRSIDATTSPSAQDLDSKTTPSIDVNHEQSGIEGAADTDLAIEAEEDMQSVALSVPFVERWTVLVSTTNWEKGAIISAWRNSLESQAASQTAYSDEAWSRRVGGITPQHVGRLRRVYQRFGEIYSTFAKLYWTHFLAAMDWDDAEMWLEGASQSDWSVSEMRSMRWQASGGDPTTEPVDNDTISASIDDDYAPLATPVERERESTGSNDIPSGPRFDEPDFGDEASRSAASTMVDDELIEEDRESLTLNSPFADLPSMPVDVAEALEQFKLAIIRHRSHQWSEFSQEDLLRTLDALRSFASHG